MKHILLFLCLGYFSIGISQNSEKNDIEAIMEVMDFQETAWNNYDLEEFMQGYWKSDSLRFFGSGGITYGWDETLANYKKSYPTKDHVGKLDFTIESISKINTDAYYLMGRYHLTRKIGDAKGIFMIIFKRINKKWKIIADTSCKN